MDDKKRKAINRIIKSEIEAYAKSLQKRYISELEKPKGVINRKKNNIFVKELGDEFVFYSALVRSVESSLGKCLETISNRIAELSYDVRHEINSNILPQQEQRIAEIINSYSEKERPKVEDYKLYKAIRRKEDTGYRQTHKTDHWFYDSEKDQHYLIELKAGGDLDSKKAKVEKEELLREYFLLHNMNKEDEDKNKDKGEDNISIYFAVAYNKEGEGKQWKQSSVQTYFAEEELKIGPDYWNFVCNDDKGYEIVKEEYSKNAKKIKNVLNKVKKAYF